LKKILLDLEENYKLIERKKGKAYFTIHRINPKDLEKFQTQFISTYLKEQTDKKDFFEYLFHTFRTQTFFNYHILLRNYYSFFPEEIPNQKKISIGKKKTDSDEKEKGSQGYPYPPSLQKERRGAGDGSSRVWSRVPIDVLVREIEGELYEKHIYISKHNLDHFQSVDGYFDLGKNEMHQEIFRKIETNFEFDYTDRRTATPLDKEMQGKLGICFNMQTTQTGYMKLHLKKYTDIETFLEHFIRIFDFLSYEEKGEVLKQLYLAKKKVKAFEYVHLANKIGPKIVVDEDFKGAHIIVKYATLSYGKKKIAIKIDYSDTENPELEFEGPEPQSKNLRDIIVRGTDLLPTFDNMAKAIFDARNIANENNFELYRVKQGLSNTGQVLLLSGKKLYSQNEDILQKQDFHFNELNALLSQKSSQIIEGQELIRYLQGQSMRNDLSLAKSLKAIGESEFEIANRLYENRMYINDLKEENKANTDLLLNQIVSSEQNLSTKISSLETGVHTVLKEEFIMVKEILKEELNTLHQDYLDNLSTVLDMINKLPGLTSKELVKDLTEELKVSRSTIYRYFRKLQEEDLIEIQDIKIKKGPGRPSRFYHLTNKLKDLLQSLFKKEE